MNELAEQLSELNKTSRRSVALFHRFAVSIGVSDSALGVLYALLESEEPCSQNELCESWSIPKQTINSAVTALQRKGCVMLTHMAGARNKKAVALTEAGRTFAERSVGRLRDAELAAFAALSPEERALYVRLNRKYNECLAGKLGGFSAE